MTQITKPVRRETFSSVRYRYTSRPLVVELGATFIRIKPKGCRVWYSVSLDQVFTLGAKNEAEARRKEKIEARKRKAVA